MYIHRELEDRIEPFLKRKEAVAIVGPRQSGKTTFLKYLEAEFVKSKKQVKFLTFERLADLNLFQENIDDFKDLYENYDILIIDEFQYAKEGGQKLKYLYDTTKTKFIISGSSSLELTFQTAKFMVGRLLKFSLAPFSFHEFINSHDKELYRLIKKRIPDIFSYRFKLAYAFGKELNLRIQKLFQEYVIYGGYPACVLAKRETEKQKILEGIFESYILKDIRSLLQLATEDELIRIVKILSTQIGNLIEYKELSNASRLNYKSLLKNLEVLRQTYILDFIKPFFTNRRTELTKNPKVYFLDLGLRNWICTDFRDLDKRDDCGELIENFVFLILNKRAEFFRRLNFWRTKSKAEVDFVIQSPQGPIPIEVKYTTSPSVGKSLYSFIKKFSPQRAIILTKGFIEEKRIGNCRVQFIPVYYLNP